MGHVYTNDLSTQNLAFGLGIGRILARIHAMIAVAITAGSTQCTNIKNADKALVPDQILYSFLMKMKALFRPRKGPIQAFVWNQLCSKSLVQHSIKIWSGTRALSALFKLVHCLLLAVNARIESTSHRFECPFLRQYFRSVTTSTSYSRYIYYTNFKVSYNMGYCRIFEK